MELVPLKLLPQVDESLLQTFFEDAIAIMERDQFVEVNAVTPAMIRVQDALPPQLHVSYIKALLSQSKSGAWQGAPAARSALSGLPPELAVSAFSLLDAKTLYFESHNPAIKRFFEQHQSSWPAERQALYRDYLHLKLLEFGAKHFPLEDI
jgi:hypothetical protein